MIIDSETVLPASMRDLLRDRLTYPPPALMATASLSENVRPLSIVRRPQPIYTSTIQALLKGRMLADAVLTGWQYFLIADEAPQGVVEVSDFKPEAEPPRSFDVLHPREYADLVNDVIARAEEIEGKWELRILRVPAIYLLAVWLKDGTENLLLPVVPPSSASLLQEVLSEEELTKRLTPLSLMRRDTPDRAKRDLTRTTRSRSAQKP